MAERKHCVWCLKPRALVRIRMGEIKDMDRKMGPGDKAILRGMGVDVEGDDWFMVCESCREELRG